MDIRIKTLKLENFKGIKDGTFDFNCQNALVEGENGTGKSTIFDAFTWLLFGKDHSGNDQTAFDIKTIDPETRQPIEKLDHSVEAVLTVDGATKTLKRIWRENWVKPKGETEQVMKGHNSIFMVDGVDVGTKKNFDGIIHEWIDEGLFRLITDPLYFIDERTPWKTRRDVLLGLVAGKVDRSEVQREFAELLKEMDGEAMDSFRKRIAATKKGSKERLQELEIKVKAYHDTLPEEEDVEALREQMADIDEEEKRELAGPNRRIAEIDAKMLDLGRVQGDNLKATQAKYDRISVLQVEQRSLIDAGLKDAQERNIQRSQRLGEVRLKVGGLKQAIQEFQRANESVTGRIASVKQERETLAASLRSLGQKYSIERTKTFTYEPTTVCHACGQELPADTVEEQIRFARESFQADQKRNIESIYEKSMKVKKDIEDLDAKLASYETDAMDIAEQMAHVQDRLSEATEELKAAEAVPEMDLAQMTAAIKADEAYQADEKEIAKLNAEIQMMKYADTDTPELKRQKNAAYEDVRSINDIYKGKRMAVAAKLSQQEQREAIKKLIDNGEAMIKTLAAEVARLERLEFDALSFIRADVTAQEEAINRLFKVARWKMFDYTLDGGIVEMCEVMTKEGASFTSMNDAAKIQCGMDTIRVLGENGQTWAPIFIDGAESVTQSRFETGAQVIRLKVKEGAELTVSAEL